MLDPLFEAIASLLDFFYSFTGNYALAIALLTCAVMVITTPLTMKGTRSMVEMQRLQPEIRRLQTQYKDDRQKLNEEMMSFYKEHQINPLGGCLPLLLQAPVFSVLFWVVRGLANEANFIGLQRVLGDYGLDPTVTEGFKPKYLEQSSELYNSLLGQDHMRSFGVDLAISPGEALQQGFTTALPYLALIAVIAVLSWFQQKQIMGRNKGSEVTSQQQIMMRLGPTMFVVFAFALPTALGVYFLISTTWRVAQQAYITRTLYRGEDSVGAQAQKAMAEVRAEKSKDKDKDGKKDGKGDAKAVESSSNGSDKASGTSPAKTPAKAKAKAKTSDSTTGGSSGRATKSAKSAKSTRSAKAGTRSGTAKTTAGGKTGSGSGKSGSGKGSSTNGTSGTSAARSETAGKAAPGAGQTKPHPRSRKKKKRK